MTIGLIVGADYVFLDYWMRVFHASRHHHCRDTLALDEGDCLGVSVGRVNEAVRDGLVDFEGLELLDNIHHQQRELFIPIDHDWLIVCASEVNQSVSVAVKARHFLWRVLVDLSRQLYIFVDILGSTTFIEALWLFSACVDQLNIDVFSDLVYNLAHGDSPDTVSTVEYHAVLVIGAVAGDQAHELNEGTRKVVDVEVRSSTCRDSSIDDALVSDEVVHLWS